MQCLTSVCTRPHSCSQLTPLKHHTRSCVGFPIRICYSITLHFVLRNCPGLSIVGRWLAALLGISISYGETGRAPWRASPKKHTLDRVPVTRSAPGIDTGDTIFRAMLWSGMSGTASLTHDPDLETWPLLHLSDRELSPEAQQRNGGQEKELIGYRVDLFPPTVTGHRGAI